MKEKIKYLILVLVIFVSLFSGATSGVNAAETTSTTNPSGETTETTTEAPKKKLSKAAQARANKWVKKKGGYVYFDSEGKRVRATKRQKYVIYEIKGKKYAFDTNGYQLLGWRKINKAYYYFNPVYGKKGRMLKSRIVNGFQLLDNGKAVVKTNRDKRKAQLMVDFRVWSEQIIGKHRYASKQEKLRIVYDYLRRLPYRNIGPFREHDKNWDLWGAEFVYRHRYFDCHPIASTFGYMARTLGYRYVKVCALEWGGPTAWHSITIINGRYYDASLGRHDLSSYGYFNQPIRPVFQQEMRYYRYI